MNQIADLKVDIDRDQDNIQLFQTQIGTVIANPGDAVRVFSNAVPPNGPYAPRKLMNIVLGILLGLMLAAGLIVLIDYMDNTVKSTLDFPLLVGGPLLATVRTIDRIKSGGARNSSCSTTRRVCRPNRSGSCAPISSLRRPRGSWSRSA